MRMRLQHNNTKLIFVIINLIVCLINLNYLRRAHNLQELHVVQLQHEAYNAYVAVKGAHEVQAHHAWIRKNIAPLHSTNQLASKSLRDKRKLQTSEIVHEEQNPKSGAYTVPAIRRTFAVNCALVFQGNEAEILRGEQWMKENAKVPVSEEAYMDATSNCSLFRRSRGYVERALSKEEASFPLAFSIATFRDVEQTERLLRSIYQPQNLYCIHVDSKSSILFYKALRAIANCFPNVWISSRMSKIKWGDISVIMSEINCLRDLLKHFRGRYKYFINLTGQEFPLRSNLQLVQIARTFNGSNDISGSHSTMEMDRVSYKWGHTWSERYQQTVLFNTRTPKPPYPHAKLKFFKGETHGLFSAKMTEFLLESFHGRMFFEWCMDTGHASEHYWNTLNYNPHLHAPGGYTGDLTLADHYSLHPVIRAKNWVNLYRDQWPCHGKVVRGLCIFSLRDLAWLAGRPELFINKFHLTYQPLAYDCMEELQRNRTRFKTYFSLDYYRQLPTVLHSKKNGLSQ